MKNIFSVALIAILSLIVMLFSCNKKINTHESGLSQQCSTEQLLSYYKSPEIQKLDKTINFISGKKTRKLTLPQAAGVIVADVGGGWKGVEWGAKIGTFLGGNSVLGGLAGGVLGAVISSGFTWWQMKGSVHPGFYPTSTNGLNIGKGYLYSSFSGQYERVGYLHNKYCNKIFNVGTSNPLDYDNFSNLVVSNHCNSIENELNSNIGIVNSSELSELKENSYNASQIKNFSDAKLFFESNSSDLISTSIILSIVERIFQVDESTNYNVIFSYANEYITLVTNDNNLTSDQKMKLLSSLNIMKYSAALWKNN